jgi:dienelactone hydrolase
MPGRYRPGVRLRGAVVLVVAFAAAVVPAAARATSTKPPFTSWTETFVDTSRPTAAGAATPAAPDRTLVTTIYRPKGTGPFPTIVFAHGSNGHPDKFTQLLGAWATAGYVVAAPAFPLTNATVPENSKNISDVVNQPADMSFVLTQLLRENRDRKSRLHGAIDRRHLGAAGLSLGGATTYGVVFDDCCRDRRFAAAMVLDGIHLPMSSSTGGQLRLDGHVPLLIAHSDTDPTIPYSTARAAYDEAKPPVWFVTLHGASHATQWENDPTPYDSADEHLTVDFWDATLRGEKSAFARLQRDATVPDLVSIESRR